MHDLPSRRGATRPFDNNYHCQPFGAGPNNSTHKTHPLCHCAQVRRVCVSPVRARCQQRTVSINPLHELLPHDVAYFGSYDSSEIYGRTSCLVIRGSVRFRSRTGDGTNTYGCNSMSSAIACTHVHTHRTCVYEPQHSVADMHAGRSYRPRRARLPLTERYGQSIQRRTGNTICVACLAYSALATLWPEVI